MGVIHVRNTARAKNASTPSQVKTTPKKITETNDPWKEHPAFTNQKKQKRKEEEEISSPLEFPQRNNAASNQLLAGNQECLIKTFLDEWQN